MEIRPAILEDVKEILTILNAASLALLDKGINQWPYPWDEDTLLEQLGFLHVGTVAGKVIATFGIKDLKGWHVGKSGKYLYQIAIQPEYQGKGYGSVITGWACEYARRLVEELYLDCWAGNTKLKDFYSENGFEFVGDFPEEDYYISVFKCKQEG
ncbi:GNAT family N-acetyltransferase [Mesobacillus jeotgali]|uniref:GNAT family N-acetyltransferase n=1 Tax=Mesobacillus jeotgali TaxID=129985 RepID=UPI00177E768C|nr:GNAT family N-acetyltransferase [Mesobacillus jeotgali]UYZ23822.1 GNAT family N-acetyltransferase [Mesobacillus jeotgali]